MCIGFQVFQGKSADAEKRHFGLPGHSPGQKGFAGSRRTDQKHPFGNPAPQFLEFARITLKFNYLLELFFGLIDAGRIVEIYLGFTFGKNFSFALAK